MRLAERLGSLAELLPEAGAVTIPVSDLREWLAQEILPTPTTPVDAKPEQWLTAEECSARLHVSTRWCYDNATELGASRLSRRCVRFPEKAVERFMANRT